jgi:hypothetical protein
VEVTLCTATTPPRSIECGARGAQPITAGCIHEHVGERDLCNFHTEDLREGMMFCGTCLAHGERVYLHAAERVAR